MIADRFEAFFPQSLHTPSNESVKIHGILPKHAQGATNTADSLVISGDTGHYTAVKVTYDPSQVSYNELAEKFVRSIDPTDQDGQFCDRGESYRSAIFVSGQSERNAAVSVVSGAQRALGKDVVTEIRPLTNFWPAEDPYQDYYLKNASKYAGQREACGRDQRVAEIWGNEGPAL